MKRFAIILAVTTLISAASATDTIRMTFEAHEVLIDLHNTPSAQRFASRLPLTARFEDFSGTEKISYLEPLLATEGSPTADEAPCDFCYYEPWGNLAVFYRGHGHDSRLYSLGTIRQGKALLARQTQPFTARLEKVTNK